MDMTFWVSATLNNFLFYGFNVTSVIGLLAVCLVVAGLAFLFEWIKLLQARQRQKELILRAKQLKTICPMMESASLLPRNHEYNQPLDLSFRNRVKLHTCDASLWFTLHNIGYFIMLMVMSYNVWIFIAVLFGGGLGYFIFGQGFMKLNLENCQVIRDTYCMSSCSKPDILAEGQSTPTPSMVAASSRTCHVVSADVSNSPDKGYQSSDSDN